MTERNEQLELLQNNPKKAILDMSIPLVFSLLFMSFYNIIDRIWVAGLGAGELAAIGYVTPLFMIIIGLGNGFGAGVNSSMSRFIGASNFKQASNSAHHGLIIGIILSILIPLILLPFLQQILIAMGATEVLGYATSYAVIVIIGACAMIFNGILSSQLRAEGAIKKSTIVMVVGGLINIILDPIFIYTLNMNIAGAAYATVISSIISDLLGVYWIFIKKDTKIDYTLKNFKYTPKTMKDIISVGIPASTEEIVMSVVNMVLNAMLTMVATTSVVAAFTASFSILQIGMMPAIGVATASITLAGIAYGAKDFERLQFINNYSMKLGLVVSIIIAAIIYIFAPQIALLFSYSSASAGLNSMITDMLKILTLFIVGVPVGCVCGMMFQGIGKGLLSLGLTIIRELVLIVICAGILGLILSFGTDGILWGMIIGTALGSLIAYIVFEEYLGRLKQHQHS